MSKSGVPERIAALVQRLTTLPLVRSLVARYPKGAALIVGRFKRGSFTGLTLTLLVVMLVTASSLLSEIAESVAESDAIVQVDNRFSLFLSIHRSEPLSKTLYMITHLGSRNASIILGLAVLALSAFRKKLLHGIVLAIILVGMGLSITVTKLLFQRSRPADIAYYLEESFSFPSGHSATAMTLYGFLIFLFLHESERLRGPVLLAGTLLILAIGFSRIYLGVHYLSDVLGGFLLGGMWVIFGMVIVGWRKHRSLKEEKKNRNTGPS